MMLASAIRNASLMSSHGCNCKVGSQKGDVAPVIIIKLNVSRTGRRKEKSGVAE